MPYIYAFDHKHRKSPMSLKDLLGGKGANLGGGGGGGTPRMFSRIHLPRMTGELRVAYEVTIRMLPCRSNPPRPSYSMRRNWLPQPQA